MGKTQIIVALGIVSTFVLGVVIAPVPSLAGENCMAKLVGSKAVAPGFDCNVKSSDGSSDTECWAPATGFRSHFFDILTENTMIELPDYGCACATTGSFKSPHFNGSPDQFVCDDDEGGQLEGKVKGKKISGQGSDDNGNALIFSCTPNTGCG